MKTLKVASVFTLVLLGCSRESTSYVPEVHINETYKQHKVVYQSALEDGVLHFDIGVSKLDNQLRLKEYLKININSIYYINDILEFIHSKSLDNKYESLTIEQAREICFALKEIVARYTQSLTAEQLKKAEIQGLYISLSLARSLLKNKIDLLYANRKEGMEIKTNKALSSVILSTLPTNKYIEHESKQFRYSKDVYEGYELGLSTFTMNEHIIIDKQKFLDIIKQDASKGDTQGLYVFEDVLRKTPNNSLSLKDLLTRIDTHVYQHPENKIIEFQSGWWPSGSSHGCCGNYSGPCWYWHPLCYVHDKLCSDCSPSWFCLDGCVKDSKAQEVTAFKFIEDFYEFKKY